MVAVPGFRTGKWWKKAIAVAGYALMAFFMLVGQWRSPLGVVAVSAIGAFALFYVFRGLVYVSLPLGAGPFHTATVWIASLLGMR